MVIKPRAVEVWVATLFETSRYVDYQPEVKLEEMLCLFFLSFLPASFFWFACYVDL